MTFVQHDEKIANIQMNAQTGTKEKMDTDTDKKDRMDSVRSHCNLLV